MKGWKIVRPDLTTYNRFQWTIGKWVETDGKGELCSSHWLHFYEDPLLAVFHNPIHASYDPFLLFKADVQGEVKRDGWIKAGTTKMTLTEQIKAPAINTEQHVRYAIGCALTVYKEPTFEVWAKNWLEGKDRSRTAAYAARVAAYAAAEAATRAAYAAADVAAWAAEAADWAAAYVARAAADVARAAAEAADAATRTVAENIKLNVIAEWAMSNPLTIRG